MNAITPSLDIAGAEVVSPLLSTSKVTLPANVTDCTFLTGQKLAACALGDGSVALVDCSSNAQAAKILPLHQFACTRLAPLGDGLVSAGQDGRVCLLPNTADNDAQELWKSETGAWVEGLLVHRESGHIAFSAGKSVTILDSTGKELASTTVKSTITGLAFDKPGKRLALSHYGGVSVVAVDSGTIDLQLAWKGAHIGLTWSPDDRFIVTATQEKELHIWDLATMEDFRIGGYPRKIHQMQWLADGLTMTCSGADAITAWPFNAGSPAGRVPVEIGFAFGSTVTSVSAHPLRPIVAGGFSTGNIMIGAAQKGEALVAAKRTGKPVTAMAWSDDGSTLAAGDTDGTVTVSAVPQELGIR